MKSFDAAKKRQLKSRTPRKKWWIIETKRYRYYIWAAPLIPFVELANTIKARAYKKMKWDESTATKVLDKVLPKELEWVEEDNAFYFNMDWNFRFLWLKAPIRYRKWANKFAYELHEFIEKGYENPLYTKTVNKEDGYSYDVWVRFEEKK